MQKTKRIIISLFIIWLSFFSFTKADNSDCWTFAKLYYTQDWWENWFSIVNGARGVSSNKYSNFLTVDEQLAIIDKESLNTALLNLKKYCCENEQWWLTQKSDTCKKDNVFFNPNALDSPYLFDHLFDVIMRRLIWLSSENDIYLKTNMSIDNKWEEWRNRIQEQSLNITWSNPQEIIDKYQETWKQSPTTAWYNIKDKIQATFWNNNDDIFLTYVSWQWSDSQESESKKIAEALKKYEHELDVKKFIEHDSKIKGKNKETKIEKVSAKDVPGKTPKAEEKTSIRSQIADAENKLERKEQNKGKVKDSGLEL